MRWPTVIKTLTKRWGKSKTILTIEIEFNMGLKRMIRVEDRLKDNSLRSKLGMKNINDSF